MLWYISRGKQGAAMGKTRRAISLIFAIGLTVAGAIASIYLLFFSSAISFRAAGAAGLGACPSNRIFLDEEQVS
jgi:hypothetical protein